LSGNLPFTARVEAQLDAVANAYFRPQSDIPESLANGNYAATSDVQAQKPVRTLSAKLPFDVSIN